MARHFHLCSKGAFPLIALLLVACSERTESEQSSIGIRDSSGVKIAYSIPSSSIAQCRLSPKPTLEIGKENANEAYLFARISAVASLSDGRIVVLDRGNFEVRVFNEVGEWLYSFGAKGEGPGEFESPQGLWTGEGDIIYIGNYIPWRLEVFSPEGIFVRTISFDKIRTLPVLRTVMFDGTSVMAELDISILSKLDFSPTFYDLVYSDSNGVSSDTVATIPGPTYGTFDHHQPIVMNPVFEPSSSMDGTRNNFIVGWGGKAEYSVYNLSELSRPKMVVRWKSLSDRLVSTSALKLHYQQNQINQAGNIDQRTINQLTHPDRPVEKYFPAFKEAKMGRDFKVWISRYKRPEDEKDNRWLIFEDNGLFMCHIDLPIDFKMLEAGSNYILGVQKNQNGLERIVKYELRHPVN